MKKKNAIAIVPIVLIILFISPAVYAANGDVSGVIKNTWTDAAKQIKIVIDDVVFPALSLILAIAFFVKLGGAYFDYRKHGMMEWTGPAILFVCLVFSLVAPKFIWQIINIS